MSSQHPACTTRPLRREMLLNQVLEEGFKL